MFSWYSFNSLLLYQVAQVRVVMDLLPRPIQILFSAGVRSKIVSAVAGLIIQIPHQYAVIIFKPAEDVFHIQLRGNSIERISSCTSLFGLRTHPLLCTTGPGFRLFANCCIGVPAIIKNGKKNFDLCFVSNR